MSHSMATTPFGIFCLLLFCIAYIFIALEERLHFNKAKPALFIGMFLFLLIGSYESLTQTHFGDLHIAFEHSIVEIAGIFFFLYVAMIYIEVLVEHNVFDVLTEKILSKNLSYQLLFWLIGCLTFFVSAVADNLTAALIFGTLALTIAPDKQHFLIPTAVFIVVSANAGGAWSPFGDITTLMAWNAGKADFVEFFYLFPAAFLGWLATGYLLARYVPHEIPSLPMTRKSHILAGGYIVVTLGILTILMAVIAHQFLHLPAIAGMMFGLSLLMLYDFYMGRIASDHKAIGIFKFVAKIENDTLLFFFGLLSAVGALQYMGFLYYIGDLYNDIDPTIIHIFFGFLSAIIDNVPLMYAVLKADPSLATEQWLLVTLTAGIGGSLISFGSAAGVAMMGKMKGVYTLKSHLRLAWTVMIGYLVSVLVWYVQFVIM